MCNFWLLCTLPQHSVNQLPSQLMSSPLILIPLHHRGDCIINLIGCWAFGFFNAKISPGGGSINEKGSQMSLLTTRNHESSRQQQRLSPLSHLSTRIFCCLFGVFLGHSVWLGDISLPQSGI